MDKIWLQSPSIGGKKKMEGLTGQMIPFPEKLCDLHLGFYKRPGMAQRRAFSFWCFLFQLSNWHLKREGLSLLKRKKVRSLALGWSHRVFCLQTLAVCGRWTSGVDAREWQVLFVLFSGWRADFMLPYTVQSLLPRDRKEHLCWKVMSEQKRLTCSGWRYYYWSL